MNFGARGMRREAQGKILRWSGFRPGAGRPGPTARDGNKGSARGRFRERMRLLAPQRTRVPHGESDVVSDGKTRDLSLQLPNPHRETPAKKKPPGGKHRAAPSCLRGDEELRQLWLCNS